MNALDRIIEQLGYELRSKWPDAKIHMGWYRPSYSMPDDSGIMLVPVPGPTTTIYLHGENALIEPYQKAIQEVRERETKAHPEIYRTPK